MTQVRRQRLTVSDIQGFYPFSPSEAPELFDGGSANWPVLDLDRIKTVEGGKYKNVAEEILVLHAVNTLLMYRLKTQAADHLVSQLSMDAFWHLGPARPSSGDFNTSSIPGIVQQVEQKTDFSRFKGSESRGVSDVITASIEQLVTPQSYANLETQEEKEVEDDTPHKPIDGEPDVIPTEPENIDQQPVPVVVPEYTPQQYDQPLTESRAPVITRSVRVPGQESAQQTRRSQNVPSTMSSSTSTPVSGLTEQGRPSRRPPVVTSSGQSDYSNPFDPFSFTSTTSRDEDVPLSFIFEPYPIPMSSRRAPSHQALSVPSRIPSSRLTVPTEPFYSSSLGLYPPESLEEYTGRTPYEYNIQPEEEIVPSSSDGSSTSSMSYQGFIPKEED
jgi:hypothetical protein